MLYKLINRLVDCSEKLAARGYLPLARKLDKRVSELLDLKEIHSLKDFEATGVKRGSVVRKQPLKTERTANASFIAADGAGQTTTATSPPEKPEKLTPSQWRVIRRKLKLHPPRAKRWLCCGNIQGRKTRKGKQLWGSVCKYKMLGGKEAGEILGMWVTMARGAGNRPSKPTLDDKPIRRCSRSMMKKTTATRPKPLALPEPEKQQPPLSVERRDRGIGREVANG